MQARSGGAPALKNWAKRAFRTAENDGPIRRGGGSGETSTYWSRWLQVWNTVRPAWPIFLGNLFILAIAFGTDQGREAVKFAMIYSHKTDPVLGELFRPLMTVAGLFCFSIGAHEACWRAISRDFPFSNRARPDLKVRFTTAFLSGVFAPLIFFIFYLNNASSIIADLVNAYIHEADALLEAGKGLMGKADIEAAKEASARARGLFFDDRVMNGLMFCAVGLVAISGAWDAISRLFRHRLWSIVRDIEKLIIRGAPYVVGILVLMAGWNLFVAPLASIGLLRSELTTFARAIDGCKVGACMPDTYRSAVFGAWLSCSVLAFSIASMMVIHRISADRHYSVNHQFIVFRRFHNQLMACVLAAFLIVVAVFFSAPAGAASLAGPVFTLLVVIGMLMAVFTLLSVVASHNRGFPIIFALMFLMAAGPAIQAVRFHNVHLIESAGAAQQAARGTAPGEGPVPKIYKALPSMPNGSRLPSLETAVMRWRGADGEDGLRPAVIVLAEGGGIRAALHTASLLSCLEERLGGELYDNLFVLSGVSGGAVGVNAYLAGRADRLGEAPQEIGVEGTRNCGFRISRRGEYQAGTTARARDIGEFLQSDFFSPALAGLFFRDFPIDLSIFCMDLCETLRVRDRAQLFEGGFGQAYNAIFRPVQEARADLEPHAGDWFRAPFLDTIEAASWRPDGQSPAPDGERPIVLMNTFDARAGAPVVVSNVTFTEQTPMIGGDGSVTAYAVVREDIRNLMDHLCEGETLNLAAAAHLSARFPLVSPPGRYVVNPDCDREQASGGEAQKSATEEIGLLVDGGYFDNSGASSALLALRELRRQDGGAQRPVVVIHVIFRTLGVMSDEKAEEAARKKAGRFSSFYEIATPVEAVVKARGVHGQSPIEQLCETSLDGSTRTEDGYSEVSCRSLNGWLADDMVLQGMTDSDSAYLTLSGRDVGYSKPYLNASTIWLRSPLQFPADEKDAKIKLPLGWLLGETGPTILKRVDMHVGELEKTLRPLVAPVPDRREADPDAPPPW